jgi:hypothetical protein
MTLCEQIKARLPLREAARLVNLSVPDRDNKSFSSPFRTDRNPSCTIFRARDGYEHFYDHSRDEKPMDCMAFYAAAKGISNTEAIKALAEHLGIANGAAGKVKVAEPTAKPAPPREPGKNFLAADCVTELHDPTDEDFEALRASRLLPDGPGGLDLAHAVGILHFGSVYEIPAWILTDQRGLNAEARRMNGELWPWSQKKTHTIKGSTKSWPLGLLPRMKPERLQALQQRPLVLVQGGPDLLAAYCVLASFPAGTPDVHPVAMLGDSCNIGDEALAIMAGRPVVIIADGDKSGRAAGQRWAAQLTAAGCAVTLRQAPDQKDLNDLCVNRTILQPLASYLLP